MPFIKLTEPGSSETFLLQQVELDTKGNWPDYKLYAASGDIIVGPKAALDRQLPNLKVGAMEDLVGCYITVSRSEKLGANQKPYWNLSISSGAEAQAATTPSKRVPPPSAAEAKARTGMPVDEEVPWPTDADRPDAVAPKVSRTDFPFGANVGANVATPAPTEDAPSATLTRKEQTDTVRYVTLLRDIATLTQLPLDAANVQGAAATLWIQWRGR